VVFDLLNVCGLVARKLRCYVGELRAIPRLIRKVGNHIGRLEYITMSRENLVPHYLQIEAILTVQVALT